MMRWTMMTLVAAVVVLCSSATAMGQDKGWFEEVENEDDQVLFNIDFPGGTAAAYASALSTFGKDHFNIIIVDDLTNIQVPEIKVSRVFDHSLFHLPSELTDGAFVFEPTTRSVSRPPMRSGPSSSDSSFTTYLVKEKSQMLMRQPLGRGSAEQTAGVDIGFEGGSLLDYIDAVRTMDVDANIVAMPGVEKVMLPSIRLRGVTVRGAMEPLDGQRVMVGNQIAELDISVWMGGAESDGIVMVSVDVKPDDLTTRVWSVAKILNAGVAEQDLLSSVQVALNLNEQHAVVRFHPETKVLMVRGLPEAVDTINGTLSEVGQSADVEDLTKRYWKDQELISKLREQITALESQLGNRGGR